MSALELSLAAAALLDRAHRRLVAVRLLDGRDGRAARATPGGAGRRSPPAPPSLPGALARRRRHLRRRWRALGDAAARRRRSGSRTSSRRRSRWRRRPPRRAATRIVPQIRRQLPERWRWTMPLPSRGGALRDPARARLHHVRPQLRRLGAGGDQRRARRSGRASLIGAAFGIGRAHPGRCAVAPLVDTPARDQVHRADGRAAGALPDLPARRCGHPRPRRRGADHTAPRRRRGPRSGNGADPSATGKALAFQRPDRAGVLRFRGQIHDLPGRDPAVGGPYAAVISAGDRIQILNRYNRRPIVSVPAPNAQALAISRSWLAYLTVDGKPLHAPGAAPAAPRPIPGRRRGVASVARPVQIGIRASTAAASSTRSRGAGETRSSDAT